MGAQTMLRASDVDIAEGTWVKDLHCSLVSLPMLWPYTSVMGLHCSSWRIQTSLADPYRMHSKLFDWKLQRRFRDHAPGLARTRGAETMLWTNNVTWVLTPCSGLTTLRGVETMLWGSDADNYVMLWGSDAT